MSENPMNSARDAGDIARAGLCASCRHAEVITSSRGSQFFLCRLAESNPQYRRYPVLPVLSCEGYQRAE